MKPRTSSDFTRTTLSIRAALWLQAVGVLYLFFFAWWLPTGWMPACRIKIWTGWPCPLCGLTRSALALGRFEIHEAITFYPVQTLFWLVFLGLNIGFAGAALRGESFRLPRMGRRRAWLLGVLLLVGWLNSILVGV